jgi:hypothetical protein
MTSGKTDFVQSVRKILWFGGLAIKYDDIVGPKL